MWIIEMKFKNNDLNFFAHTPKLSWATNIKDDIFFKIKFIKNQTYE